MKRLTSLNSNRQWLFGGAAVLIALGAGFGIARITAPSAAPAEAHAEGEKGEEGHADEEGHGEEGHVEMDAERMRVAGVQVLTVASGSLAAEISAQGSVRAQPQGEAVLAARADGVVTRINRRLGDAVQAGEAIATIESRDASAIAADRASASAQALAARQTLERERRLFEAGVSPRQDLEAAQARLAQSEAEVRRTTSAASAARVSSDGRSVSVVSPISGRITQAPVVLGAFVTAGAELFRVADVSKIEVQASLPALDIQRVSPGDVASVETPAGIVPAVVRSITPGVDAESRAATAVLTLSGATASLRPGQAVRVRITPRGGPAGPARIVVPDIAVQSVEGRDVVFVRTSDGFQATPVVVASRGSGRAEILSGLKAGQVVAVQGAFVLKAELGKGEAEHAH